MTSILPDKPAVKRVPKKQVQGEKLIDRIFQRDTDQGGTFVIMQGLQGCGKTSLMLGMATKIIKTHPDELVFWREAIDSPSQFNKIGDDWQILAERSYPLKLLEITNNMKEVKDYKIRYFEGFKQLLLQSKPGMLNVVFFKDLYKWVDFLNRLRLTLGWQAVFMDEFEDVAPEFSSGETWKKNRLFGHSAKHIRKGRVNLIVNTQNINEIDFRVRGKATISIYLYGSRVDSLSPVSLQALHGLRIGQGWIDHGHSVYGQFTFPPFKPKPVIYTVTEGSH